MVRGKQILDSQRKGAKSAKTPTVLSTRKAGAYANYMSEISDKHKTIS